MNRTEILVIDDDAAITEMVECFLSANGYTVRVSNDGDDALEQLRANRYSVVISDIYIDQVTGLDILREAKMQDPRTEVILITARGSVRTTVEAESGGAFDYLAKPFAMGDLLRVVQRASDSNNPAELHPDGDLESVGAIIGFSPGMVEVYKKIARSARSDETVLIVGETGVGKELVARAIHENSLRTSHPFCPVDSGAIPGSLWETEIFGSVRGAFTGADRDHRGIVDVAAMGTVFFDEVGEIPLEFQAKLLRFLQEKEYRPVGANAVRQANVRVIAATNRNPEQMVAEGGFRPDLYYRLNVLRIDVPPLRERKEDIDSLVNRFLAEAAESSGKKIQLSPEVRLQLQAHPWPGNVRQLRNVIHRLVALGSRGRVRTEELCELLDDGHQPAEDTTDELGAVERNQIRKVLQQTGGNKTRAAKILGIQRRTLYKKLAQMERENSDRPSVPEAQS